MEATCDVGKNPKIVNSFDYKHHNLPLFQELFDIYPDRFYQINGETFIHKSSS